MQYPPAANKYRVIYADPPWSFATYSAKGKGRSPDAHYDCLTFDDLCRLPVAEWAAPDATLLLWTTDPQLPRAIELIRAWGFTYKTVGFYWAKTKMHTAGGGEPGEPRMFTERDFFVGMGYWTRANAEQCLLATRGSPKRKARDVRRLVISPRRDHSRKPDEVYGRIERLVDGPYLEMFARTTRPGWDCWGTETTLFDRGPVAARRFPSQLAKYPDDVPGGQLEP